LHKGYLQNLSTKTKNYINVWTFLGILWRSIRAGTGITRHRVPPAQRPHTTMFTLMLMKAYRWSRELQRVVGFGRKYPPSTFSSRALRSRHTAGLAPAAGFMLWGSSYAAFTIYFYERIGAQGRRGAADNLIR
jgi:hypothetical protein